MIVWQKRKQAHQLPGRRANVPNTQDVGSYLLHGALNQRATISSQQPVRRRTDADISSKAHSANQPGSVDHRVVPSCPSHPSSRTCERGVFGVR